MSDRNEGDRGQYIVVVVIYRKIDVPFCGAIYPAYFSYMYVCMYGMTIPAPHDTSHTYVRFVLFTLVPRPIFLGFDSLHPTKERDGERDVSHIEKRELHLVGWGRWGC